MKNPFAERPPEAIEDVVRLASVLMMMDSSGKPFDAEQYRCLIVQLTATLRLAPPGDALEAVLKAFPATELTFLIPGILNAIFSILATTSRVRMADDESGN